MAADRPEKSAMRQLWVERVVAAAGPPADEFLYLTLPGAEGRDVKALIDAGVIDTLETPAIATKDAHRVAAIESRAEAESELQGRFPGLLVKRMSLESLVHSHSLITWPQGESRDLCRAKVMNLDLNSPFKIDTADGQLLFPQVRWISKLAELHAAPPRVDWCLLLTLHAQIEWPATVEARIKALLAENFQGSQEFAVAAERLLGGSTYSALAEKSTELILSELSKREQQLVLMTLIPKKLAQALRGTGWRLVTRRNLRYGGIRNRAPMISFIFDFVWDEQSSDEPERIYKESIFTSIDGAEEISSEGEISTIAS